MDALAVIRSNAETIRDRFGVARIGVFGSFARGEATPESDLDVLVVFQRGRKTFDNFMDLKFFLEDLTGRSVDLVTTEALKPRIKPSILKETVYA